MIWEWSVEEDRLTGLPRVMNGSDNCGKKWLRAVVNERISFGDSVTLAYFDLDHLRKINDMFGLGMGNKVLCCFGAVLTESAADNHLPLRVGGEEFIYAQVGVDPDIAKKNVADIIKVFASRKVRNLYEPNSFVSATVTAALSYAPKETNNFDELWRVADERMQHGKNSGRGEIYD